MKKALTLSLLCLLFVFCGGCTGTAGVPRYFAYLDEGAQASLSGNIDGLAFTALLQSEGRCVSAGDVASGTPSFTLIYLSPASLAGLRVRFDAQSGQYSFSLGELEAQKVIDSGLGEVGHLLLFESAVQSTHKQDGWTHTDGAQRQVVVLSTTDGAVRIHDSKTGVPLRVTQSANGRSIEIDVQAWENR